MRNIVVDHLARFLALILVQVLVLDHLDVANGYMVPQLYVLFLLMLPVAMPAWGQLFAGFGTGLVMDLFSGTPGLHTSACLVLCQARVPLLRMLAPRGGYEFGRRPSLHDMGAAWFFAHAGVLVLLHHLWLFIAEAWRIDVLPQTLFRAVLSAAFTLALCLLSQYLAVRRARA